MGYLSLAYRKVFGGAGTANVCFWQTRANRACAFAICTKKVPANRLSTNQNLNKSRRELKSSLLNNYSKSLNPAVSVTGSEKVRGCVPCSLVYAAIAFMISLFFSLRDTM